MLYHTAPLGRSISNFYSTQISVLNTNSAGCAEILKNSTRVLETPRLKHLIKRVPMPTELSNEEI
jgi:hypothetical protein